MRSDKEERWEVGQGGGEGSGRVVGPSGGGEESEGER